MKHPALTDAQLDHARALHENSIVIDMLFQGPIGTYSLPEELEGELLALAQGARPGDEAEQVRYAGELVRRWYTNGKLADLYEECWTKSGITAACRQLSIRTQDSLMLSIVSVQEEFDHKPWLVKARTAAEIERAHANGQRAGIVTSQEAEGYGKDLGLLELAYDFGLRVQQLTYNNHNLIGAGCMEPNDAGLSRFGMKFVAKCDELGVVVDTSHCGRQTTLDACARSERPVVATHTGASAVYAHDRCKSDAEIRAIAETGGVIGVFAMPWFVAPDPHNSTLDHVLDHVDHIVDLVGIDSVGIGTDWPMPQTKWMALEFKRLIAPTIGFAPGDGPSTEWIHGLKDYREFPNVTAGLLARGYGDEDAAKVLGGNWLRVLREVCG
ncbi:MAG: membrane dipeptidase [Trueperaceae bacterium]|nr:membrane dipeptidase [Trueperaceae bacterium]MCC6311875.1 membrane dipeptidase [Trueperaceae bacterium]MCO5174425.1 dipeptidase [Trueperaceae bacterium]